MDEMKELNVEAYEYLEAIEPSAWCMAHFSELPKCDLLLNNTCEVFNKYVSAIFLLYLLFFCYILHFSDCIKYIIIVDIF
jgi:hypothetical protein